MFLFKTHAVKDDFFFFVYNYSKDINRIYGCNGTTKKLNGNCIWSLKDTLKLLLPVELAEESITGNRKNISVSGHKTRANTMKPEPDYNGILPQT